jgi:hypothetical protein
MTKRLALCMTSIAILLTASLDVWAADAVKVLWIKTRESGSAEAAFQLVASATGTLTGIKIETSVREVQQPGEIFLAVQEAIGHVRANLVFGLTSSQTQLLAEADVLQPFSSEKIKAPFSSSLYFLKSSLRSERVFPGSEDILAVPIDVTLTGVCYNNRDPQITHLFSGDPPTIKQIAGNNSVEHINISDPRVDPVGRAVLLSAVRDLNTGWYLFEGLDRKVDFYNKSYISSCINITDKSGDIGFTTVDALDMMGARDDRISVIPLRGGAPIASLFAGVLRRSWDGNEDVVRVYAQMTKSLLENRISALIDRVRTRFTSFDFPKFAFYDAMNNILSYRSTSQIVDDWAARYDHKTNYNTYGVPPGKRPLD